MENHVSNYEMMKHQMQEKFAACDLEQAAGQWELGQEDDFLTLTFVGRPGALTIGAGNLLRRVKGWEEHRMEKAMWVTGFPFSVIFRSQSSSGNPMRNFRRLCTSSAMAISYSSCILKQ